MCDYGIEDFSNEVTKPVEFRASKTLAKPNPKGQGTNIGCSATRSVGANGIEDLTVEKTGASMVASGYPKCWGCGKKAVVQVHRKFYLEVVTCCLDHVLESPDVYLLGSMCEDCGWPKIMELAPADSKDLFVEECSCRFLS